VKKVAISIDSETLPLIDSLLRSSKRFRNRSALVREAIRAFAASEAHERTGEDESRVIRQNERLLSRQLRALEKEQASS
jgi:Arc/MetJ-type ribon-helix-helix transcriptional regulator